VSQHFRQVVKLMLCGQLPQLDALMRAIRRWFTYTQFQHH
ncbi:uncharacterized protein METZ01_LOCUS316107, partial [marine metagenome]